MYHVVPLLSQATVVSFILHFQVDMDPMDFVRRNPGRAGRKATPRVIKKKEKKAVDPSVRKSGEEENNYAFVV